MAESDKLTTDVDYIKHKVTSMEITMENLLRVSGKEYRNELIELLDNDEKLKKVFDAIDGKKSQIEIAAEVNTTGFTVSKKIQILYEHALIELVDFRKSGKIYKKSKVCKILKLK